MSDGFRWDPSYSVGFDEFDEDHKRLLTLGSAVSAASSDGRAREAVACLLDALGDESTRHFAREEKLMRETGYPLLLEHHDQHNRLSSELHLFIQQYEVGHLSPDRLAGFLVDWVVSHIVTHDKKFQQHWDGLRAGRAATEHTRAGGIPNSPR